MDGQIWVCFLSIFGNNFGAPFWDQIGQRGGKMSPREPSGASKSQKAAFSKKVAFAWDCRHFFALEASQENLKRPEKVPKRHPKRSKGGPKLGQKVAKK